MAKNDATQKLKESIRLLEIKQADEAKILKEQFKVTYDSLKPVNILKRSIKEISHSVEIKESLFETIVSIVTSYVTKKMVENPNSNLLVKLLGALLKFGIREFLAKYGENLQSQLSELVTTVFQKQGEKAAES